MEKYGQYRDKGSGIAPFFPIPPIATSPLLLPWNLFLFCVRLPFILFACFVWLAAIQWMTPGTLLRKANLWCIIGIPGIWWVDLQVDGVRRGSLGKAPRNRTPGAGSIIASSYTSPIDILYLATIFDPIFAQSYPGSRLVRPLSLTGALINTFTIPPTAAPSSKADEGLVSLSTLQSQNPSRIIAVFPEATTSNARSILRLTPSLLSAAPETKVFPVSIRYTPADIVTPVPGWKSAVAFLWRLNSKPTHCIRTRIGAPASMSPPASGQTTGASTKPPMTERKNSYESNYFDTLTPTMSPKGESWEDDEELTEAERRSLDTVADTLARLGRVKRVSLGAEEKAGFLKAWLKRR